jgi:hypothetical protein
MLVGPCIVVIVILTDANARVLKTEKPCLEGGRLFEQALLPLFSPLFPPTGARLLLRLVMAAATVGLWLPRASHKVSAALIIAAAVLWFREPTASHMEVSS